MVAIITSEWPKLCSICSIKMSWWVFATFGTHGWMVSQVTSPHMSSHWRVLNSFPYSGQKMFTEGAIQFFNLFYTSLPIVILGVYDTDLAREYVYRNPRLYECGAKNQLFNVRNPHSSVSLTFWYLQRKIFWWQIFNAIWDSVILTYLPIFQMTNFSRHGIDESIWHTGSLIFTAVVVLANMKVLVRFSSNSQLCNRLGISSANGRSSIYWSSSSPFFHGSSWLSLFPMHFSLIPIGLMLVIFHPSPSHSFQLWEQVLSHSSFWLSLICVVIAVYLKDLYLFLLKIEFNPSDVQILLEVRFLSSSRPHFILLPSPSFRMSRKTVQWRQNQHKRKRTSNLFPK